MKNLLFLLISLVAFSMQVDAKSSLTRLQAWTILKDSLRLDENESSCVYASTETVGAKSTIHRIINDIEAPNFDGWFFFAVRLWWHTVPYPYNRGWRLPFHGLALLHGILQWEH